MRRKAAVWLAITCVLALTLSASGSGLAWSGHDKEKAKGGGHGYGCFNDVGEENWAYRDITRMEVKGVFGGYGNGMFGPQDSVSCLQLAILAVRVTGAEDAAMIMTQEQVDAALAGAWLDPADPVPNWPGARACLAFAYENGYLNGFINQEKVLFRPTQPATRLEVIVTLIDVMGLTSAAAALAEAPIDAPDVETVPAWAHGYVALALDMGLLRGDNTGALNLDAGVSRAQMAALLSRTNGKHESKVDDRVIKARLVSVTTGEAPSITVEVKGGELNDYVGEEDDEQGGQASDVPVQGTPPTGSGLGGREEHYGDHETVTKILPVSPEASIFRDGESATLEELVAGDRVELRLDADGLVIYIDATAPKADEHDGALGVSGPFVSAEYEGEVLTSITIVVASVEVDEDDGNNENDGDSEDNGSTPGEGQPGNGLVVGEEATFAVSPDVRFGGSHDATVTFTEGDYLHLKIRQDEVVVIDFGNGKDEGNDENNDEDNGDETAAKGKIGVTFVSADGGSLTVTVTADDENLPDYALGATVTLPVSDDLKIDGPGDEETTLADLTAGLALTLDIKDGVITKIKIGEMSGEGGHGEQGDD